MSDFWTLSSGEEISATDKFDLGGGNLEPIPDGTNVLAAIEEVKWDHDRDNFEFLSIKWGVLAPEEYNKRKVFQKLWVSDHDPRAKTPETKRDKARSMLATIDKLAGGHLKSAGGVPSDTGLQRALQGKQMILRVNVWKMKDESTGDVNTGNWVGSVSAKNGADTVQPKGGRVQSGAPAGASLKKNVDDSVPFARCD